MVYSVFQYILFYRQNKLEEIERGLFKNVSDLCGRLLYRKIPKNTNIHPCPNTRMPEPLIIGYCDGIFKNISPRQES